MNYDWDEIVKYTPKDLYVKVKPQFTNYSSFKDAWKSLIKTKSYIISKKFFDKELQNNQCNNTQIENFINIQPLNSDRISNNVEFQEKNNVISNGNVKEGNHESIQTLKEIINNLRLENTFLVNRIAELERRNKEYRNSFNKIQKYNSEIHNEAGQHTY